MGSAATSRMKQQSYDLFVIGAGSGGVRAARIAASHGAKVAIAEEYRVGGTCVIRGCVPKKLMVYASRFADEFEDAAGFGWSVGEPRFDWPQFVAARDREIARLEAAYHANLERSHVAVFPERAAVDGPKRIKLVASGGSFDAERILIATGARPVLDERIPGIEYAISSNELFHLKSQPRRLVVIGGGYIALEFACVFQGLGSDVTVIHRGPKVLRGFDEDLRDDLMAALQKRGVAFKLEALVQRIDKTSDGLAVSLVDGARLACDAVLMATGRAPNTAGLGLEAAGVKLGPNGRVPVDARAQTNVPSIYAVGDVTDRVNLTPVAIREGHAFADTTYGGTAWEADHTLIPSAVFTTPEIGTVGLSETAAREKHGAIDIYKTRFRPMRFVMAGRDERMLMKLVVDPASGRVLGVHILGPDAAEIVQMAAIAMKIGVTKSDFDRTMALHPSAAEELVTLRDKWVPQS